MLRALAFSTFLLLLGLSAAPAAANQKWRRSACPTTMETPSGSWSCATVRVPLDHSGKTSPGRVIDLRVGRLGRNRKSKRTLVYLSGGPGAAGINEASYVPWSLPIIPRRFNLIGFDQRGTGGSGVLRCGRMQRDERVRSTIAAERCADQLGLRRSFYTTQDSVGDLDAVRRALGVERMTLFGVSYGTQLALAYARTYPERVEQMILDSAVDPDQPDPYGLASFKSMGPILAAECGPRCVSDDPLADLQALTAKLAQKPLRGYWFDGKGRRRAGEVTALAISDLIYDADYFPAVRAAIPGAVRAALLNDDPAQLLRLFRWVAAGVPATDLKDFSAGRYATICEETALPWARNTPIGLRSAAADRYVEGLGPNAFLPFDRSVADADEVDLCRRWPVSAGAAQPPRSTYEKTRTLIVQGMADVRTPASVSAALAKKIPGAQRITVGGVGHGALTAPSKCLYRNLRRFLDGEKIRPSCPTIGRSTGMRVQTASPSFAALRPVRGYPRRIGRTIGAVAITLRDVRAHQDYMDELGLQSVGGLRGGSVTKTVSNRILLRGVVVIPGVRIGGTIDGSPRPASRCTLRVGGSAAAHGSLVFEESSGRLTGRLGGRRVRARILLSP